MNLYKIEYDLDEKKFKADIENGSTTEEELRLVLIKLKTHVFANNLFDAVEKVKANVPSSKYMSVGKITPEVIGIKVME